MRDAALTIGACPSATGTGPTGTGGVLAAALGPAAIRGFRDARRPRGSRLAGIRTGMDPGPT